jgi:hypothetical protein
MAGAVTGSSVAAGWLMVFSLLAGASLAGAGGAASWPVCGSGLDLRLKKLNIDGMSPAGSRQPGAG